MLTAYNSKIFRSQNASYSYPHDNGTKKGGVIYSASHSRSLARPGIVAGYPLPYPQVLLCVLLLAAKKCQGDKTLTVLSYISQI